VSQHAFSEKNFFTRGADAMPRPLQNLRTRKDPFPFNPPADRHKHPLTPQIRPTIDFLRSSHLSLPYPLSLRPGSTADRRHIAADLIQGLWFP